MCCVSYRFRHLACMPPHLAPHLLVRSVHESFHDGHLRTHTCTPLVKRFEIESLHLTFRQLKQLDETERDAISAQSSECGVKLAKLPQGIGAV